MKKIITLFLGLIVTMGFSQNNPIDFEPGGYGADWTWTVFENETNPPLEIITNPDPNGINTSATVAKFTAKADGNPWAGVESQQAVDLGTFTWNDNNRIVKIMVWKSVISDVGIKFATETDWAQLELKVSNTLTNEWEELTFDFSNAINPPDGNGTLGQIIVFPDFAPRTQDNIVYFDNITFNAVDDEPSDGPTVAAPTPPARDPDDVLSVFSDAYTDVAGTNFNPGWGQTTQVSFVDIDGNETLKYGNFNYQGTEFASALNVTEMETLHLDMWTADATSVNIFLISPGPVETAYALPITPNQWISYDIPLTAFTGVNLADVIQFKFDGGNGSQTIYLDNLYFYKENGVVEGPRNPIDFEPGGFGADWTWTVFENETNPPLEIIANPDPNGINTSATVAKFTAKADGNPYAGVESLQGVDLGTFEWSDDNRIVKIHVWKPVISDVGIKFATETGWAELELKVSNTVTNEWEELTFDFSNAINPPDGNGTLGQIIIFPDFAERSQDNIVYFDNITFNPIGDTPPPPTSPTVAAPAPPEFAPENVIALHAQGYTSVPVDTWRTDWSAATYEEVMIAGRPTKRYSNLDFVGIETVASQIDITGMTHFHAHVWSPDFTLFRVKLVDIGADGAFGGGDDTEHEISFPELPQGEWISLNIPLADFTDLQGRQNIAQLIFSGQPVGATTVYIDNILFYNDSQTSVENISVENIRVYPNPVAAGAQVKIDASVRNVDVIDFSGRLVFSGSSSVISTEGLRPGVYILRIQTPDGMIQNQKLMVR